MLKAFICNLHACNVLAHRHRSANASHLNLKIFSLFDAPVSSGVYGCVRVRVCVRTHATAHTNKRVVELLALDARSGCRRLDQLVDF